MVVVIQLMGDKKENDLKIWYNVNNCKNSVSNKKRSFPMNIITQLNALHLIVAFLSYDKTNDLFIITSHLTVAFLPYSKNRDVFIITSKETN